MNLNIIAVRELVNHLQTVNVCSYGNFGELNI